MLAIISWLCFCDVFHLRFAECCEKSCCVDGKTPWEGKSIFLKRKQLLLSVAQDQHLPLGMGSGAVGKIKATKWVGMETA